MTEYEKRLKAWKLIVRVIAVSWLLVVALAGLNLYQAYRYRAYLAESQTKIKMAGGDDETAELFLKSLIEKDGAIKLLELMGAEDIQPTGRWLPNGNKGKTQFVETGYTYTLDGVNYIWSAQ